MMKFWIRISCAVLLVAASARAQFTSQWSAIYLPGSFNGYDTVNSGMTLVSNGVWQAYVRMTNFSNPAFLFSNHAFDNPPTNNANVWKETNQSQFGVPLSGTAELNAGSDIVLTGKVSGIFRFTFNEASGAYSVKRATFGTTSAEPWINELHYDNTSLDINEGVEIAGASGLVLTNYSIVLYNGDGGGLRTYKTNILSGALTNDVQAGIGVKWFGYPTDEFQNGSPDGVALVKNGTGVIQFISYEGLFIPTNGPAAGMVPQDIGVFEDAAPIGQSLQLWGAGGSYADFSWVGPVAASRDLINAQQLALGGPAAASVTVSAVAANPPSAQTNQSVSVSAVVTPLSGASNVSPTLFWRAGVVGAFQPIRMTNSGTTWTTVSNIPPHPNGTVVRFYVFVNFDGPGTNSPTLNPANAPSGFYSVSFSSSFVAGSVWINEVDATPSLFTTNNAEYVELVGAAGNNIAGWTVELVDPSQAIYATYTMPGGTLFANKTNGFGFLTVGRADSPGLSPAPVATFTNFPGSEGYLLDAGGIRLKDGNGAVIHAICYGTTISGFTFAGHDPDVADFFADGSIALTGSGSNFNNFVWATNAPTTYAAINAGQTLTGGNTSPIPPTISCPADVFLSCANSAVPTNNPLLVSATGYCGNGSVTVTWAGDTTNGGTGCKGNARVVTRTYRAVSACGTTSTCSQLFILEDTNAPVIIAPTQTLVNAGFENGSTFGWQTFGLVTNQTAAPTEPRSGFFAGILSAPYGLACLDSSIAENHGLYVNGALRMQAPATTNLLRSVTFDGANDYVSVPAPVLNTFNMTITCWIKRNGAQVDYAGLVFSRAGSTLSGLDFTTGQQLGYHWNGAADTSGWQSGIRPPDNQWAFLALTVSSNKAELYMKVAGSNWMYAANVTNHAIDAWDGEVRLGHDNTANRYFKGGMDEVQIYNRTLPSNEIMTIWNNGIGGNTATNQLVGRYPLDDFFGGASQSGLYQDLPASGGQQWTGYIYARHAPGAQLTGTNTVRMAVQYLNATNGVLLSTNGNNTMTSGNVSTNYLRLSTRATAPTGTAKVRMLLTYQQDADGSTGQMLLDDALLTDTVHIPGTGINTCGTLGNLRTNPAISILDGCSGTNVTVVQTPAVGSAVTNGVIPVTLTATDPCGNSSMTTFNVIVDDITTPTIFSVLPNAPALTCSTTTVTNAFSVLDNCSGWFIEKLSSITNDGLGCPSSPIIVTNIFRVTDIGGNTKDATQIITISDNVRPTVILSTPALTNGGFETGTLTNWSTYGNATLLNLAPRNGSFHAKLAGQTNGPASYNGLYQDLTVAAPGDAWRLAAWVTSPTNEPLTGENILEVKIEYFDADFIPLQTDAALPVTNGVLTPGLYQQISVSSIAPFGATRIRATVNFLQSNNAPGTIHLDDLTLSRTTLTPSPGCEATAPGFASLLTRFDCGLVTVTQTPFTGSALLNGTNTIRLYAVDNCGNTTTTTFPVVVMDLDAPAITNAPANLTVATTNDIPAANTNHISGLDTCTTGLLHRTVLPDRTNGGAGTTNNPLLIFRTYRIADAWGNTAQTTQTITVNGGTDIPPAPTNVLVRTITLQPNAAGHTNIIRSTGTNTWSVLPEYTTNLLGTPFWQPASNIANLWANGTNTTTFTIPTSALPAFIRIKQTYP